MKPGERIRLIKRAAELLQDQLESDVDLALSQHQLPTQNADWYEGNMRRYATDMLTSAEDQTLVDLVEFLEGEAAGQTPIPSSALPWSDRPTRVFLSHVHDDRHLVGETKRLLEDRYGVAAFVAHDDIHPSKTWREQIKIALASCDLFVAFVNQPKFHESQWCDQETGWALARSVPILPIRFHDFDRTQARDGFLEEHQDIAIPANTPSPEFWCAFQIFMAVVRDPRLRDQSVKSIAEAFVNSRSYDSTRRIWALIENQPNIESEQLRRLEYATQTNRQVYEAVVDGDPVPVLVKHLVEKFEPPSPSWPDEAPF